ncbi:predicted protein [Histoplasma capsulatum var. duboisii H88]|uniref:Predicted protein n=1 Tax=Ajellomyces capsulatus (strain H88) TaxID=544711 RepID=F0UW36_AJEC8|nr:predicted protein [Histoplasma capsulatum var. duboisii H88]
MSQHVVVENGVRSNRGAGAGAGGVKLGQQHTHHQSPSLSTINHDNGNGCVIRWTATACKYRAIAKPFSRLYLPTSSFVVVAEVISSEINYLHQPQSPP